MTGRWTAKDPLGFAAGDTNLYAYVAKNPIGFADPSGLLLSALGDLFGVLPRAWARSLAARLWT